MVALRRDLANGATAKEVAKKLDRLFDNGSPHVKTRATQYAGEMANSVTTNEREVFIAIIMKSLDCEIKIAEANEPVSLQPLFELLHLKERYPPCSLRLRYIITELPHTSLGDTACMVLGKKGDLSDESVAVLTKALLYTRPHPQFLEYPLRHDAAIGLASMGSRATSALPVLREISQSVDPQYADKASRDYDMYPVNRAITAIATGRAEDL